MNLDSGFSLVLVIVLVLIIYIFLPSLNYTKEQKERACECYSLSYEVTGIAGDDLPPEKLSKRIECFDLFTPEGFRLMKDDIELPTKRMREACD